MEYPSEYFIDGSPICKNCVDKNIKSEEIKTQVVSSGLPIDKLSKKYVKGMIIGFVLEYIGLVGVVLGITDIISKGSSVYVIYVIMVGMIIILVFTYKLCKLLEFSLIKSLLISVINIYPGFNIITLPWHDLIYKPLKIKGVPRIAQQKNLNLKHELDGYVGGIVLFFLYGFIMSRKQNPEYITPLAYYIGTILEFIGGPLSLFMVYVALRKKMAKIKWFINEKWIASLIAGIISLYVTSVLVVLIQMLLYQTKIHFK